MRLTIVAVGRLKERYWREASDEYLKRLRPYARVRVTEVSDEDLAQGVERARRVEGDAILRAIPPRARVAALDPSGRALSSEALAEWLGEQLLCGRSNVTMVLGGSAGLAEGVLERADELLSLSTMTLPHQLCRVVLLEQVYRAHRILRKEPYHR